jgi:hypothetical protein
MDTGRAWHGLDLQFTAKEQAMFFTSTLFADRLAVEQTGRFWEDRWLNGQSIAS